MISASYVVNGSCESDSSEVFDIISSKKYGGRVYFTDKPNTYITKIQKQSFSKRKIKKTNRVFNLRYSCVYCQKQIIRICDYLHDVHGKEKEVCEAEEMTEREKRVAFDILRNKGDHQHNLGVLKQGHR